MKIDLEDCVMNYIGDMSWYGETNHDNESLKNMDKAKYILDVLYNIREHIFQELLEHKYYRHGNASAEMLHEKAKQILDNKCSNEDWIKDEIERWDIKCPLCGEIVDELIDTEGMINGGIGYCCQQCLEDNDIGR